MTLQSHGFGEILTNHRSSWEFRNFELHPWDKYEIGETPLPICTPLPSFRAQMLRKYEESMKKYEVNAKKYDPESTKVKC